jgi:hypothetical protein
LSGIFNCAIVDKFPGNFNAAHLCVRTAAVN